MVSIVAFILFLVFVVYRDRKKFERESIILIRRTQRGKGILHKIGNSCPKLWKIIGTAGVCITMLASVYIFFYLVYNTLKVVFVKQTVGALQVVLPSPTQNIIVAPGIFAIPFWYWIIPLAILVVAHEGSHGIMSVVEKVPIKSLGWGLLLVIPLAFVEPDEKSLEQKGMWSQLRVFAAGSFANFILGGIFVVVAMVFASMFFVPSGVAYSSLIKDYPASKVNLSGVIVSIDGKPVRTLKDLIHVTEEIGPNKTIEIITQNRTSNTTYILTTTEPPKGEYNVSFDAAFWLTLEQYMPGIIDISRHIGQFLTRITGGEVIRGWSSIENEIKMWEYAEKNYPLLKKRAELKISELKDELKLHKKPGYIGILGIYTYYTVAERVKEFDGLLQFLYGLFVFTILLNFGIGFANMLPIKPLDGGRMWDVIFKRVSPKNAGIMTKYLGIVTFMLIILNFIGPLIKF